MEDQNKFRVYNDALLHASTCENKECKYNEGRCLKVRSSIDHFTRCYSARKNTSDIKSCQSCGKLWGLLCFHATYCATSLNDSCSVVHCNYLRNKIIDKQRNEALELMEAKDLLMEQASSSTIIQRREKEWSTEQRKTAAQENKKKTFDILQAIHARTTMMQ